MSSDNRDKNPAKDSLCIKSSKSESADAMIRRFVKKVKGSGLVQELLDRKAHDKPSVKKKKKQSKARFVKSSEKKD